MKEKAGVRVIATILHRELMDRCEKILKPSSVAFHPIYLESTLLDPKYKIVLNHEQLQAAKSQLILEVRAASVLYL